jgi:hypothetical protein
MAAIKIDQNYKRGQRAAREKPMVALLSGMPPFIYPVSQITAQVLPMC